MKLVLDTDVCQGYGLCQMAAPDLVDLDDSGYAELIGDGTVPASEHNHAHDAVECMPGASAAGAEVSRDLTALFDPASIAVVGASTDPAKWGNAVALQALRGSHRHRVQLVNRSGGEILGNRP